MEKYGTIPPKFTKAWWDYIWYYYKFLILVTTLIVAMAGITIFQLTTKPDYDIIISYIGEAQCPDESKQIIIGELENITPDRNENGKKEVSFTPIVILSGEKAVAVPQHVMATETKKTMEIQKGETIVFIFDENQLNLAYEQEIAEGMFLPCGEWLNNSGNIEYHNGSEKDNFVKLPRENEFTKCGIESDSLYVGIRVERADEKDYNEKLMTAKEFANNILR